MASPIKLKRSAVPGKVPATTDMELGELAVNTYDGKLYLKSNFGTEVVVQIGPANFLKPTFRTVMGNTTATAGDCVLLCDCAIGPLTVNLPAVASVSGIMYFIKKIDATANKVTIDANGSQTIEGSLTVELSGQFDQLHIQSDGSEWLKLN